MIIGDVHLVNIPQGENKMVRKVNDFIKYDKDNDTFDFDFSSQDINDILLVSNVGVFKSNISDSVYWFGYKFNENIDSKLRTKFIDWLKGLVPNDRPKSSDLYKFIDKPLACLNKEYPLVLFDAFVYPKSNRSELVNRVIDVTLNYLDRSSAKLSFELIKNLPKNISFDFESFKSAAKNDLQIKQVFNYVNNDLLNKIHSLDYFSIAQNVKPKYRKYITNFLKFKDEESKLVFSSLQSPNILIIDDINTSGSTINEIIRIIKKVNPSIKIFIFTLIGKELLV